MIDIKNLIYHDEESSSETMVTMVTWQTNDGNGIMEWERIRWH